MNIPYIFSHFLLIIKIMTNRESLPTMTDFNAINNFYSDKIVHSGMVDELLTDIGFDYVKEGAFYVGDCFHDGADGKNLSVGTKGDTLSLYWRCVSKHCHQQSHIRGNLMGLVRGFRNCSFGEAERYLIKFTQSLPDKPMVKESKPIITYTPSKFQPRRTQEYLRILSIPAIYWTDQRNQSFEVVKRYNVGTGQDYRTYFPCLSDCGEYVLGYISRSVHSQPCKLCGLFHKVIEHNDKCPIGGPRWKRNVGGLPKDYLYGYREAKQSTCREILIVEGAGDVLSAATLGKVAVSLLTAPIEFPASILTMLLSLDKHIVLALDNDKAGIESTLRLSNQLSRKNIMHSFVQLPSNRKDLTELVELRGRELVITDKCPY